MKKGILGLMTILMVCSCSEKKRRTGQKPRQEFKPRLCLPHLPTAARPM